MLGWFRVHQCACDNLRQHRWHRISNLKHSFHPGPGYKPVPRKGLQCEQVLIRQERVINLHRFRVSLTSPEHMPLLPRELFKRNPPRSNRQLRALMRSDSWTVKRADLFILLHLHLMQVQASAFICVP